MLTVIVFFFFVLSVVVSSFLYIQLKRLYIRYQELERESREQQKSYFVDFKKVVTQLQEFCANSEYMEYQPEVKSLLTYLRSFVQKLSSYVTEGESELNDTELDTEYPKRGVDES